MRSLEPLDRIFVSLRCCKLITPKHVPAESDGDLRQDREVIALCKADGDVEGARAGHDHDLLLTNGATGHKKKAFEDVRDL